MTPKQRLRFTVSVVLEYYEDGVVAYAPAFKGIIIGEDTEDKALEVIRRGIETYMYSMWLHNETLPIGPDLTVDEIPVPDKRHSRNIDITWPIPNISGTSLRV